MHKALRCTCSQNHPLLSPSFLISFDLTQSLLLDLCLCNPLSSLLIGVECNSFCSSVHLHYTTNHISLYFFLWCITPDYRCSVNGSVDLGSVVASFFQFLLLWFLPLSTLSSHSHVCYLWLIVMSIFLHFCHPSTLTLLIIVSIFFSRLSWTHSLFPFSSAL